MIKEQKLDSGTVAEIVHAAKANPAALGDIYDRYVQDVYRYLYSRVQNESDAEDLTARTFLTVLENLPSYRERGRFKAWLFTIAHHTAMDFFRSQHPSSPLKSHHAVEDKPLLTQVIQSERIQRLSTLIQELDPDEQELLRLRYVAGLTFAEMGHVLGMKTDTAKKSLYRLQARLRAQMEAYDG